jgi:hypothetical protein
MDWTGSIAMTSVLRQADGTVDQDYSPHTRKVAPQVIDT